jgi:hypothetical protein
MLGVTSDTLADTVRGGRPGLLRTESSCAHPKSRGRRRLADARERDRRDLKNR